MPLPGSPAWEALSADEQQAVGADYQAVSKTEALGGYLFFEAENPLGAATRPPALPVARRAALTDSSPCEHQLVTEARPLR